MAGATASPDVAYGEWAAFHLKLYQAGQPPLSADQSVELERLTTRRQAAMDALVELTTRQ